MPPRYEVLPVVIMFVLALCALVVLVLLFPAPAHAQAACTHYAASNGSGAACTQQSPCKVQSFWPLAGPGKTLCLASGTYRGAESMVTPPPGVRGTAAQPLTVRAEHDGQVLLDAQHQGFAVLLGWHEGAGSNDWMVVEGVNATNGLESIVRVASANSIVRRVLAWHGTSGAPTDGISIVGYRSTAEDCGAWGMNLRKTFQGSQAGNLHGATYRRCWGEWNDHPETDQRPNNTLQIGYNSMNQRFENLVMTWNTKGQTGETEGVIGAMTTNTEGKPNDIEGTQLLGSVLYIRPGTTYSAATVFLSGNTTGLAVVDSAFVVPPGGYTSISPAYFLACSVPACARNTCTNCLAVHDGRPLVNESSSGWTLPGLRQGKGLQAATGGRSAFELLPGICRRYVGGALTDQPLWPWPMEARLHTARVQSGYGPTSVTGQVEQALGPIPAACKGGEQPPVPGPGPDTTPPSVTLEAPTHNATISGTVAVAATASDNVGIRGIQFYLDKEPVGEEQPGESAYVLADSTKTSNGLHKLKARAYDQAGNWTDSSTIDIHVYNGSTPAPSAHPPLACTGGLGEQGRIVLECLPQAEKR